MNPLVRSFKTLEIYVDRYQQHREIDIGFVDNPNAGLGTCFSAPKELAKELRLIANWLETVEVEA